MNPATSPAPYSHEKNPNSTQCSDDANEKGLYTDEKSSKRKEGDATYQAYGETRQSLEQTPWTVKDTLPNFIRSKRNGFALDCYDRSSPQRSIWIPVPTSFHDLVQIVEDYGTIPMFCRIPHVMQFPEFAGYNWYHRKRESNAQCFFRQFEKDQDIFRNIVRASYRMGRAPLCAPDYFYLGPEHKGLELWSLFLARGKIPGIEWNTSIETEKMEEHVDWTPFCEYIRRNVPTAEFLFDPPKVWDEIWFARTVSELGVVPARAEIVHMAEAAGYEIGMKTGWFGIRSWSLADEEVIQRIALPHWIEWRKNSEQDLERLGPRLIEL